MKNSNQSTSFWMSHCEIPDRPALSQDIDTEIVIVGSGIIGITTAYILSKQGKKVVVVDAETPKNSQTARTTGHLVNVLDDRYIELERLFGKKNAALAAKSHTAAVDFIEAVCKQESINCKFERLDAYLFAPPDQQDIIKKEYDAVLRAGIQANLTLQSPLDFDTGLAIRFPNQAQFFPLEYLNSLIQVICKSKGQIFFHTRINHFEESNDEVIVTSESGFKIRAKYAVVATNSPVNDRFMLQTKLPAYRTYVIAGAIPKGSVTKGLYYDTLDPYHYIRLAEADGKEYLILGGEDHRTGQNETPNECYKTLIKWASKRFPMLQDIEYKWSGQILEATDSLAYIGKNPLDRQTYIATGDSGNGLTHGTIAAMLISDLILHKKNPWVTLYKPNRKNIKSIKNYTEENLNTLSQYRDWFLPGNKKCSGKIVQDGLTKKAIYQNYTLSAVCPHLGGIVRWNEAENTWDCPCHGSRFAPDGTCIEGPACSNLKKIKGDSK